MTLLPCRLTFVAFFSASPKSSPIFSAYLRDHIQQLRQRRQAPLQLQPSYLRLKLLRAEFERPKGENLRLQFRCHLYQRIASAISYSTLSTGTTIPDELLHWPGFATGDERSAIEVNV